MLRGLGVTDVPAELTEAAALFRSRTAGRRLLVVLDNARDSAHISSGRCSPGRGAVTVVTQPRPVAVTWSSPGRPAGSCWARCGRWTRSRCWPGSSAPERVGREPEAARRLVARGDHLPLAVRVVGERLTRRPGLPLCSLSAETFTEVRTAISWSYDALDPPAQRVPQFAGGLHPDGEIDPAGLAAMLAAVAGTDRRASRHAGGRAPRRADPGGPLSGAAAGPGVRGRLPHRARRPGGGGSTPCWPGISTGSTAPARGGSTGTPRCSGSCPAGRPDREAEGRAAADVHDRVQPGGAARAVRERRAASDQRVARSPCRRTRSPGRSAA